MGRINSAENKFRHGYACSQAILTEYCEYFNLDIETALKLAAGFAGGMQKAKEEKLFQTLCPEFVKSSAEILESMLDGFA